VEALQEAISISRFTGDKRILGYSLEMLFIASTFINIPGAAEAAQEGLVIFTEEIDDTWGRGMAYQNMIRLAAMRGDLEEKEKYFRKLREQIREVPLSFQAGLFFLGMGMEESVQGNYEVAKQLFEDGLKIFRRLRNRNFQTVLTSELGHIARRTEDINQAKNIYKETLRTWQDLGNRAAISHQLECFGFLAIAEEEPQRAIKLFGAADALREKIQAMMTDYERAEYEPAVAQARSFLTEEKFNSLWAEGRAITIEEAIQLALEGNS
jgi:tetratricopeptide (TPR) repeat protein